MIDRFKKVAALGTVAFLAGCMTVQGEQTLDWTNLPGDTGAIRADLSRDRHDGLTIAAERLALIDTLTCGPFQIALNANSRSTSRGSKLRDINQQGGRGELFEGFILTVQLPDGFTDRIRFRQLIFPDLNARTFLRENNDWRDITNPERTVQPPGVGNTYRDLYPSFDPSLNTSGFFDNRFIVVTPWADFHQRSIFWNNGTPQPPNGRYRVSFTTPYEIEWPDGSCEFRLPDMEFDYQLRSR